MRILVLGEILWDIFPDAERLGGAPFNFAVHTHRLGHEVIFASAVGNDERGDRALARMAELGLSIEFVRRVEYPTGIVTVAMKNGEPDFLIHRPAAYDFLEIPRIQADWIYYGTLAHCGAASPGGEPAVQPAGDFFGQTTKKPQGGSTAASPLRLAAPRPFYDMNLRKNCFTPELVESLLESADVVKLNEAELAFTGRSLAQLRDEYHLEACCVTRGERGCAILIGHDYAEVPGCKVNVADPVGAGDAFAAAFLHGLNEEWPAAKIGALANRVGAAVAGCRGAIPEDDAYLCALSS